jgi:hypothetical protein
MFGSSMKISILLFEWIVWFFLLVLPPQFPALGLLAIHGATGFFISHRRSSSCVLRHRSLSCPFSQLCSGALCAANCFFDLVFAAARKLVSDPSSGGPFCFPVAWQGINSSLQIFLSHKIFVSSSWNSSTGQIWSFSVEIFLYGWFLTTHSICLPSDFALGDFSVRLILLCSSISRTRVLWPLFCRFVYESKIWFCVNCCRVLTV